MKKKARPTELGPLVLESLAERWKTLHDLLDAARKKAATRNVHDLRIALRRMASVVDIAEEIVGGKAARKLDKKLEKALETLGRLRDVQVQRKEIGDMAEHFAALGPLHEKMRKAEKDLEPKTEKKLDKVDVDHWKALYEALLRDASVALSSETLRSRHAKAVVEAVDRRFSDVIDARRALDVADLKTMHHMRVAFKKFRYMVEVLQPMLRGMGRAQLDSMHAFQSMMGDVHDLDVLNQMVAEYRAAHKKQSNDLVAAQDDIGRRLLQKTDLLVASADEIFAFWNQSYLPQPA